MVVITPMMRFTLIEHDQAVSFVAPTTALAVLVAGCARDPASINVLLSAAERDDPDLVRHVRTGLARFDEHNAYGDYAHIHTALHAAARDRQPVVRVVDDAILEGTHPFASAPQVRQPVFRVVDDVTRAASLQPYRWGLVLFNVARKRIIQIENTYAEIRREGHVPTFPEESADGRQRVYRLPPHWQIVP